MTEWQPAFEGQREPFREGNTASLQHGARSERRLRPLAEARLAELLAGESTPEYLRVDASYRSGLASYARALAAVELITDYLSDLDVTALLDGAAGALEQLRRWEAACVTHRRALGLDPTSRARLQRDLTASRYMSGLAGSPLSVALDRIEAERRALEAGGDEDG